MLIKKKKLARISHVTSVPHTDVTVRATQLEIHKAKQEAKAIKQEAEEVLQQSQQKLKEAEHKIKEIVQNATLEANELKKRVYSETLQIAQTEAEKIKAESSVLLKELFEVKKEVLSQAHKEIIEIALDLASKIIKYQAHIDPNVLKTQVIESIKKATSEADRVQVYVNPVDLKLLEDSIPEIGKLFPSGIDIVPLAKESVDPGSCVVETKSGQLDATFSTQLKTLTDLMTKLEIKEPNIQIEEKIFEPVENKIQVPEEIENQLVMEEDLTQEEQLLKEELLSEEPLINFGEEETYSFSKKEEILEIPKQIADKTSDEEAKEVKRTDVQEKKKLIVGNFPERTKEETEELDEPLLEYEEGEEEQEEEIKPKNILRPKIAQTKPPKSQSQVSDIASEIEKNPEWQELIEEEDEN